MRILLLTHSFNSLAQRLYVELAERGHEVSVEFDIADSVTEEACALFRPGLVIAPFMKRAIPESVWRNHVCLVVHPGIVGDRGPSALDWAILNGEVEWGVTVLQANAVMDGGDIWASGTFPMREARKSSLYRNEITEAAARCVLAAVERFEGGGFKPEPLDYAKPGVRGQARPLLRQAQRRIDWARDDTATVLRKIRASDSFPGVLDEVRGVACHLYNAWPEGGLRGAPGEIIARRDGAILRATTDGAVWITHLKPAGEAPAFKLPATMVLGERVNDVPEIPAPPLFENPPPPRFGKEGLRGEGAASPRFEKGGPGGISHPSTWQEIRYEEADGVGYLHFEFHNGAMSTEQCLRLRDAYLEASRRPVKVIALMGGADFWSNGIHLNLIEAADSPADESWANINAMDDLCLALLENTRQLTLAAMQGNAGAGGVFLALAADRVLAREGVILNPHYKGMGNLYGSEYWTYLLPRRVGGERAAAITGNRLPIGARRARELGLVDECFGAGVEEFRTGLRERAEALAAGGAEALLAAKRERRARDEAAKPLAAWRAEELEHMKLNFYGFDPSYHVARYHFVHRVPHAWTPLHLARHRRNQWALREALTERRVVQ
jgi:putative two-component system hydrogenase maturation factor HypX/HoxX